MGLSQNLPLAEGLEAYLWADHKKLQVTIFKETAIKTKSVDTSTREITVGDYALGRISIYPCDFCNGAYLTRIFLHEICHAWINQYREKVHDDYILCAETEQKTEKFCDYFSNDGFKSLGGQIPENTECRSFILCEESALKKIKKFSSYFKSWQIEFDRAFKNS